VSRETAILIASAAWITLGFIVYVVLRRFLNWRFCRAEALEERLAAVRALHRIMRAGWKARRDMENVVREFQR